MQIDFILFRHFKHLLAKHSLFLGLALFGAGSVVAYPTQHVIEAKIIEGRQLADESQATPIKLPHSWNNDRPQREGIATYFLTFTINDTYNQEDLAVYMPRIGNRYEIYVNDELIHNFGTLNDTKTFATHKTGIARIPKLSVLKGQNTLTIVVAGEAARYAGLSTVSVGNYEVLYQQFEQRQFLQIFSSLVIVIVCFFIAFVATIYSYFARSKHFFVFGLGALAFGLNNSYLLMSFFPFNHRILLFFYDFFQAVGTGLMCLTIAHMVKIRVTWYPTLVYGYLYFSFFALVIYHDGYTFSRTLFLDCTLVFAFISFVLYLKSVRYRLKDTSIVTFLSLLTALLLVAHDQLFVYHNKDNDYEMINFSRYTFLLLVVAIATSLAKQFIRINTIIQKSRSRMDLKLDAVKQRLSNSYTKRASVEKRLTLQQERWRLMQDMHDGIGHRLLGLQQAVQDPEQTSDSLNQMVKQTIAELRTTIQSIHNPHDNVSFMLGDLRERLDFLCLQYEKKLQWSVDEMPVLSQIDDVKMSNIEKIILEIFSNIAKHSCADWVKLTAVFTPQASIVITVEENGEGYEGLNNGIKPSTNANQQRVASQQHGLLGISRRAAQIHARLYFEDKGRTVRLNIPL